MANGNDPKKPPPNPTPGPTPGSGSDDKVQPAGGVDKPPQIAAAVGAAVAPLIG